MEPLQYRNRVHNSRPQPPCVPPPMACLPAIQSPGLPVLSSSFRDQYDCCFYHILRMVCYHPVLSFAVDNFFYLAECSWQWHRSRKGGGGAACRAGGGTISGEAQRAEGAADDCGRHRPQELEYPLRSFLATMFTLIYFDVH